MLTPLDDADRSLYLSDVVAEQLYKDLGLSPAAILWAGQPNLKWVYWWRTSILAGLALFTLLGTICSLFTVSLPTFWWVILLIIVLLVDALAVLILLGAIALTKRNQGSYYAFDQEHLYLYSTFQHKGQKYPLAELPDFIARRHADGTITLRGNFRWSKTTDGQSYKTPVLYCLSNGQGVLDLLRSVQNAAKKARLEQEQATPSWLPRD
ncbi:MAG: hypothetical protein ACRBFS_00310 [Aureispira sp.]